jgi:uncharacterized protein YndB with AHSA1/START domain
MRAALTSLALFLAAASAALPVRAAVRQSAPDGFVVEQSVRVAAPPEKAWATLVDVARWWSDGHSWSGSAAHLRLDAVAGGCLCERWDGGSVEHARVLMAVPARVLRLEGALGPLQELPVTGVLGFALAQEDDGATRIDVSYRVGGNSGSALDSWAPAVDEMLAGRVARLARTIDTGNPEPPPPQETESSAEARAAILRAWRESAEETLRSQPTETPPPRVRPLPPRP